MSYDSINDEILRIKRELAARFDNDLDRIVEDTKSRERNTITLPPRRCKPKKRTEPSPQDLQSDPSSTAARLVREVNAKFDPE